MNREVHVRVWERAEVKFLRATRQNPNTSRMPACQLPPAADIRLHRLWPASVTSPPIKRLEISFSQGAEWKALISTYIGTIPLSGDAPCAAEQSILDGPAPNTPVNSAMIAKVPISDAPIS